VKPKPHVAIPVRPKFAGIGAKHGQTAPDSTVRVNVKRTDRRTDDRSRVPKPFFFGGGAGGGAQK
jgi:hypothetical protein